MALQMDPGEILREYNASKNKSKQVSILAELNACAPREIIRILQAQGAELLPCMQKRLSSSESSAAKRLVPPTVNASTGGKILTAAVLKAFLDDIPPDTPVQICGHAGFATSAIYIIYASDGGKTTALRIQREE